MHQLTNFFGQMVPSIVEQMLVEQEEQLHHLTEVLLHHSPSPPLHQVDLTLLSLLTQEQEYTPLLLALKQDTLFHLLHHQHSGTTSMNLQYHI
jgi:hypothetical protein